jgi:exopolysaccharide biosynthesis polyprenyl glycosylphosphotransferase
MSNIELTDRERLANPRGVRGFPLRLPNLGLRISERLMLLALVDTTLVVLCLLAAIVISTGWVSSPAAFFKLWRWWVTLVAVWWVMAQLWEVYDLARAASAPHSMVTAGAAAALAALVYQMIPVVTPPLRSRGLAVLFIALAGASVAAWRGIYAILFSQPAFETRVLIFGAGAAGAALATALRSTASASAPNPYRGTGYRVVGFVDDDPKKLDAREFASAPVLGPSSQLERIALHAHPDEVVLAITHRHTIRQEAFDSLLACRALGYRVTTMEALYERVLGRVAVDHVGRNIAAVLPVEDRGATERLYWSVKRLVDIGGALLALIPLALAIPLVVVGNAMGNSGPLLYRQIRVGRGGRCFRVLKFRTMTPDAEATSGAVWAKMDDSRVTRFGQFLRRSRIDELPQVLNVLAGQMSLIGPRPERPEFVEQLAAVIPFYKARHAVKPGLTGWAQVRFGYAGSVEHARIKLEYDLYYARHAGFYLDLLVTLKTAAVVLRLQGW